MCIYHQHLSRYENDFNLNFEECGASRLSGCLLKKSGEKNLWNLRFPRADKTEIESVVRTRAHTWPVHPARIIFDICSMWRIYSRARLSDCVCSKRVEKRWGMKALLRGTMTDRKLQTKREKERGKCNGKIMIKKRKEYEKIELSLSLMYWIYICKTWFVVEDM